MTCLNLSIPAVKDSYDELVRVFGIEDIAYAVLAQNNGHPLELTPEGKHSLLYERLINISQVQGDRNKALRLKARIYTPSFIETHGDWVNNKEVKYLDKNGEPKFEQLGIKDSIKVENVPNIQDKGLEFLRSENRSNINRLFGKYSYTVNTPSKFKDLDRMKNMLELSSEEFINNGLFIADNDRVIAGLNHRLFNELVDTPRLIENINKEFTELTKGRGFKHNVINSKKYNGEYWVTSTDESYREDLSIDEKIKRRTQIVEENLKQIEQFNQKFIDVVDKPAIQLTEIAQSRNEKGKLVKHFPPIYKVTIDEQVLKEYNAVKYTNYLNNIIKYTSKDDTLNEEMNFEPLAKKLKQEQVQLKKQKATLETTGGSQTEINKLDNKIESLSKRIEKLNKDGLLEDIYAQATIDLAEVDELLSNSKLSTREFRGAMDKLETWIAIGDFSKDTHLFLDEEQLQSNTIKDEFARIRGLAENRMASLVTKGKGLLSNIVNEHFGTQLTYEQILKLNHKLGLFNKGLSLNRVGQALAQFVQDIVNKSNDSALREAKLDSRELADLYEKVKQSGFDDRDFYQFREVVVNGVTKRIPTGL